MCNTVKELLREAYGMSLYTAHRIETLMNSIEVSNDTILFMSNELNKCTSKASILLSDIEKEVSKANAEPEIYRFKRRKTDI